jgi:hypothetical protein
VTSAARLLAAGLVAVALVVAFFILTGGDDDDTDDIDDETVLPLLGTPGDVPDRPALAVKIDATDGGRPQAGIGDADVVFEEMVEGGLTRFLAVYHSDAPEAVGPVRSARSSDLPLLADLDRPLFAWSGANPVFAAAVRDADIVDVGLAAVPDAYHTADGRSAPYNLFASPADLWDAGEVAEPGGGPPPPLFDYRPVDTGLDATDAEPAGGFSTSGTAGLATAIRWEWDAASATWVREQDGSPHIDDGGEPISAANVLIRFTPYEDTGLRDAAGAEVPEAVTTGEGEAWLFTDGQIQQGTWRQPSADAPTTFTGTDGTPFTLTPGQTWVEVLPPGSGEILDPSS